MKNLLSFEEFIAESITIDASKKGNFVSPWMEAMPFRPYRNENVVVLYLVNTDPNVTQITYYDKSRSISKDRLASKENYEIYVDYKTYLFKPIDEIWPSLKALGLKLPSKPPAKSGFHKFEGDPISITVFNQISGRGTDRSIDVQLSFVIQKDDNHDSNVKKVSKFIKENCFYPNNTPVPSQEELMESVIFSDSEE